MQGPPAESAGGTAAPLVGLPTGASETAGVLRKGAPVHLLCPALDIPASERPFLISTTQLPQSTQAHTCAHSIVILSLHLHLGYVEQGSPAAFQQAACRSLLQRCLQLAATRRRGGRSCVDGRRA